MKCGSCSRFLRPLLDLGDHQLTLENDGLKQVVAGHNRSVQALLKYVQVATKCDVTPEELARAADSAVLPMRDGRTLQVAQLAFSAEFQAGEIRAIEITDVGKVTLCRGKVTGQYICLC